MVINITHLYERLQILLQTSILDLNSRVEDLEKSTSLKNDISLFLGQYQNGQFNFLLLEKFYQELNIEQPIDDFIKTSSLKEELLSRDPEFWHFPIEQCDKVLNFLIMTITKKQSSIITEQDAIQSINSLKKEIDKLEYIHNAIGPTGFESLIDQDLSNYLLNYLEEKSFSKEEILAFTVELTKSNAIILNKKLQLAITERKAQLKKHHQQIDKRRQAMIQKGIEHSKTITRNLVEADSLASPEPSNASKEVEVLEESTVLSSTTNQFELASLTEQQQKLINQAFSISKLEIIENEIIDIAIIKISNASSVEKRLEAYDYSRELKIKKMIISRDLKENILPKLLNNQVEDLDKYFKELEQILNFYNQLEHQQLIRNIQEQKTIFEHFSEDNRQETLNFCVEVSNLLEELYKLLFQDYHGAKNAPNYIDFCNKYVSLKEYFDLLDDVVKLYYVEEKTESNKAYMEECLKMTEDAYNEAKKAYLSIIPAHDELYLGKAHNFYKAAGSVKNLIAFVDDNEQNTSIVESDIISDQNLRVTDYAAIIRTLQERVTSNFSAGANTERKDHKIKSDHYSEEFLQKYKVKSMANGRARIFYSRLNCNIGTVMSEYPEDLHVLLIYSAGAGNNAGREKCELNEESLKRCWKDKKNIDKLTELLKTDWSSLSPDQRVKRQQQINEYFKRQNIKLGHLIHQYELLKGRGKEDNE